MKEADFLVVGGGIFGVYSALYLADKGHEVVVVEKEGELMRKASIVNQARLHGGYHYPRSVATALMSDENKARFTHDHRDFILFDFDKYYAIDRFGSLTDAAQFERFCQYIDIPCTAVKEHPLFNYHRLEAVFKTVEYTFDPILIARYYDHRIRAHQRIQVLTRRKITEAHAFSTHWETAIRHLDTGQTEQWHTGQVINATYSASNSVNRLFGQPNYS
ncbi:MAG: FAD-dependent oxidoreductase [Saprospiraceae bacterium]